MSKFPIKSIFEQIAETVFTSTNTLDKTKSMVIEFVKSKDINEKDKETIIKNVKSSSSIIKLQTYVCNSLLQFEGLGLNQLTPKSKINPEL